LSAKHLFGIGDCDPAARHEQACRPNETGARMSVRHALNVTREDDFPAWYQAVVREADLAEMSPVRGCMVIKPWGYGIWELVQAELDRGIKATGHENCYFPLFIPLSFFAKEAEHVEGFAKEMAVVTHYRLKAVDGALKPDPDAALAEPLIVRPTSETVIGDAFNRWIQSYRDLPLLINQWANVVRWEMRTRLFLRTAEFLWQEGHTAHASEEDAREETMKMLEVYRSFAEDTLAMPVIAGEKPENERFPGAVNTYSIEAMMQDGKALQSGTSHYLGENFARAQDIRYQDESGQYVHCHTTSWGLSTRVIGGVIMTHGDDDGLRLPPAIAPKQIVIVPMLRGNEQDAAVLEFCDVLAKRLGEQDVFRQPLRVLVDKKQFQSADKRWNWVRRGAPIICEIGPRDVSGGNVSFLRRDALRNDAKMNTQREPLDDFVANAVAHLEAIQSALFADAKARLTANITRDVKTFDQVAEFFGEAAEDDDADTDTGFKGWVQVPWSRPTGDALAEVDKRLKTYKLTIRCAPLAQPDLSGAKCIFTGDDAVEEIIVSRAY
jgi:prolyl-tRNA synthetase